MCDWFVISHQRFVVKNPTFQMAAPQHPNKIANMPQTAQMWSVLLFIHCGLHIIFNVKVERIT
jgi:hypothetical protein